MKKILVALTAVLSFGSGLTDAAVPQDGYYLDKDGTPLSEEQTTRPAIKAHPMAVMSQAVHDAMAGLPNSSSTLILLTVNEDGIPVTPVVTQSSGSVILDAYAVDSVQAWTFIPSKRGEKVISSQVQIPIRFTSMMVTDSAKPEMQPMKDPSHEIKTAMERNHHPVIYVSVYVTADGSLDGKPKAEENDSLNAADFKILAKYAESCVRDWTFTPAKNPDGESIPEYITVPVQL